MSPFLMRQEQRKQRIYLCGDYLSHAHTGGACASGRRTASTILEHWGSALAGSR